MTWSSALWCHEVGLTCRKGEHRFKVGSCNGQDVVNLRCICFKCYESREMERGVSIPLLDLH